MEVYHSIPGTSFSFPQPGKHHEDEKILAAKRAIETRFVPILKTKMVPYEIHIYAEMYDVSSEKVGDTILKNADEHDAALVVLASHNKVSEKDRFSTNVGSVARYIVKQCKRPLAVVNPGWGQEAGLG